MLDFFADTLLQWLPDVLTEKLAAPCFCFLSKHIRPKWLCWTVEVFCIGLVVLLGISVALGLLLLLVWIGVRCFKM